MGTKSTQSRTKLLLAFAAIYLLWGSTYLAIRLAIDTLPPFFMAGVRFLTAGLILISTSARSGVPKPSRRHWRNAVIAAVPLFVIGNGGVTWAEQAVPSGAAALVIATLPAWLLLLDWGYGGRMGPKLVEVIGIGLGLAGVAVLSAPGGLNPVGAAVLLAAAVAWAIGSLFNRYADLPASPIRTAGMQMFASGAIMVVLGLALGEAGLLDFGSVSWKSVSAVVYLVAVALVAVPAYNWLFTVTSPAVVGTYAFVNPLVAVLLGWALADEVLTSRTGTATGLVVIGVMLLVWPRGPQKTLSCGDASTRTGDGRSRVRGPRLDGRRDRIPL
jgi:drug/metabolite transporter (DMT)-like permease